MINKDEIMSFASETGLAPNVVEKDYVLGWLLAAIYENPILNSAWNKFEQKYQTLMLISNFKRNQ